MIEVFSLLGEILHHTLCGYVVARVHLQKINVFVYHKKSTFFGINEPFTTKAQSSNIINSTNY